MRLFKVAFFCLLVSSSSLLYAKTPPEDFIVPTGNACMIKVNTDDGIKMLNTQYIRNIGIESNYSSIVRISMASNYSNDSSYRIKFATSQDASNALENIANNITYCRENAIARMKNFRQEQENYSGTHTK